MEKSLSGVTTLFQVFGLQFFPLLETECLEDGFHNKQGEISKKQKLSFVLVAFCLALEFGGICYAFSLENGKEREHNQNVKTGLTVQFLASILIILLILVAVVNAYVKNGKLKTVFRNFDKVSKILKDNLKETINYQDFARQHKLTFVKTSACFVCGTFAMLAFIYQHNQSNILLWAALVVFPNFFVVLILSYLIFFVKFVTLNLNCMIKVLEKLQRTHDLSKLGHRIVNIESKFQQRNSDELFESIMRLKKIFGHISETTSLINEIFGLPLITLIVVMIMGNISGGYKLYLSFMGDIFIVNVAVPIYGIFVSVAILSAVVAACSSAYDATDVIVSRIANFELDKQARQNGLQSALNDLNTQIYYQPLKFTVAGFYVITKAFLASIITGVMTYVIILAQFYSPTPKSTSPK